MYYALFHFVARECADLMIGASGAARSKPAWVQTYRALEHGYCRAQCENTVVMKKFPKRLKISPVSSRNCKGAGTLQIMIRFRNFRNPRFLWMPNLPKER